ncbi:MAG: hypothetical protein OEW93_01910 [Candidatus Bathyarchaeota archaeon]|nr:hypothetical protein [Candidatus Bathyarchaeota archaeon]
MERTDLLFLARLLEMSPDHVLKWLLQIPVGGAKRLGDLRIWRRTYAIVCVLDLTADKCVYQGPLTQLFNGAEVG